MRGRNAEESSRRSSITRVKMAGKEEDQKRGVWSREGDTCFSGKGSQGLQLQSSVKSVKAGTTSVQLTVVPRT